MPEPRIARLLEACPELLCCDVHTAGTAILAFKQLGFSDEKILERILPNYPQLLTLSVDRHIRPVVAYLHDMGCSEADIRTLSWEVRGASHGPCPALLLQALNCTPPLLPH